MERKCDYCGNNYIADDRNVKRGWGLCCSKSCAAHKREKSKPNYDANRVLFNNIRREQWNDSILDKDFGDKCFVDKINASDKFKGRTSEGYRIFGETAFDEWGEPIYSVDPCDDTHPFDLD